MYLDSRSLPTLYGAEDDSTFARGNLCGIVTGTCGRPDGAAADASIAVSLATTKIQKEHDEGYETAQTR